MGVQILAVNKPKIVSKTQFQQLEKQTSSVKISCHIWRESKNLKKHRAWMLVQLKKKQLQRFTFIYSTTRFSFVENHYLQCLLNMVFSTSFIFKKNWWPPFFELQHVPLLTAQKTPNCSQGKCETAPLPLCIGQCFHYSVTCHSKHFQQKSAGHTCPYCRCDIRGTESILIEPYLPGSSQWDEDVDEGDEEDDHEDIEVVVKEMAALRKVSGRISVQTHLFSRHGNVGQSSIIEWFDIKALF